MAAGHSRSYAGRCLLVQSYGQAVPVAYGRSYPHSYPHSYLRVAISLGVGSGGGEQGAMWWQCDFAKTATTSVCGSRRFVCGRGVAEVLSVESMVYSQLAAQRGVQGVCGATAVWP